MPQSTRLLLMCLAGASVVIGATNQSRNTDPVALPDNIVINRIVARVNSDVITANEVGEHEDLGDRIDHILLVQRGRDLGIRVDGEVARHVAEAQKQSGLADADAFHAWFIQKVGIPFEDWKQQTTEAAMVDRVISQEVASRIVIPTATVESYYAAHKSDFVRTASVKLRETLVVPDQGSDAAWARAEKAALEINKATAQGGIDLPMVPVSQLRGDVAAALAGKARGEMSAPVRGPDGYRVYFVEERIADGQATLEDARNEIMDRLFREKLTPALRTYLGTLRESAYLQIRPGYLDSGALADKDTAWKEPAMLLPETTTAEAVRLRKKSWFRVTK